MVLAKAKKTLTPTAVHMDASKVTASPVACIPPVSPDESLYMLGDHITIVIAFLVVGVFNFCVQHLVGDCVADPGDHVIDADFARRLDDIQWRSTANNLTQSVSHSCKRLGRLRFAAT